VARGKAKVVEKVGDMGLGGASARGLHFRSARVEFYRCHPPG
jgi:hypothetical protein